MAFGVQDSLPFDRSVSRRAGFCGRRRSACPQPDWRPGNCDRNPGRNESGLKIGSRAVRGAPENLLDTYEEERRPKAAEVLKETDRTTRLLLAPDPITKLVRDLIVLPIIRSEFVQRKLFARLAQLDVNYRGNTLSRHFNSLSINTVLKAGDRAPDIAFRQRDKISTLFELLRPFLAIALVRFDGKTSQDQIDRIRARLRGAEINMYIVAEKDSDSPSDPDCLIDIYGDFARLYGMTREFFCLIRPDDHIGLFQSPVVEDAIADYIARIAPY